MKPAIRVRFANFNELTIREIQFYVPPWVWISMNPSGVVEFWLKWWGKRKGAKNKHSFSLNQHRKESSFSFSRRQLVEMLLLWVIRLNSLKTGPGEINRNRLVRFVNGTEDVSVSWEVKWNIFSEARLWRADMTENIWQWQNIWRKVRGSPHLWWLWWGQSGALQLSRWPRFWFVNKLSQF